MWLRRRIYPFTVLGCSGFFLGRGTEVMWPEWSAWTWWGLAAATPTIGFGVPALYRHYWGTDRPNWPLVWAYVRVFAPTVLGLMVAFSIVGYLGYYVIFVYEPPPEPAWVHPDLPEQEQRTAIAECRMKAFEAIGGGDLGTKPGDRREYTSECLTAQGFVLR